MSASLTPAAFWAATHWFIPSWTRFHVLLHTLPPHG